MTNSIVINGIVKPSFEIGLFYVEIPDFDTPIGPRIEKALRRYNFERDTDLKWKDLGQRVWTRLGVGDVDTSKVSRIKQGAQQPSISEGGAFAYELDCSPLWLFWAIGDMGRFPRLGGDGDNGSGAERAPVTPFSPALTREEQAATTKSPKRRRGGG